MGFHGNTSSLSVSQQDRVLRFGVARRRLVATKAERSELEYAYLLVRTHCRRIANYMNQQDWINQDEPRLSELTWREQDVLRRLVLRMSPALYPSAPKVRPSGSVSPLLRAAGLPRDHTSPSSSR